MMPVRGRAHVLNSIISGCAEDVAWAVVSTTKVLRRRPKASVAEARRSAHKTSARVKDVALTVAGKVGRVVKVAAKGAALSAVVLAEHASGGFFFAEYLAPPTKTSPTAAVAGPLTAAEDDPHSIQTLRLVVAEALQQGLADGSLKLALGEISGKGEGQGSGSDGSTSPVSSQASTAAEVQRGRPHWVLVNGKWKPQVDGKLQVDGEVGADEEADVTAVLAELVATATAEEAASAWPARPWEAHEDPADSDDDLDAMWGGEESPCQQGFFV